MHRNLGLQPKVARACVGLLAGVLTFAAGCDTRPAGQSDRVETAAPLTVSTQASTEASRQLLAATLDGQAKLARQALDGGADPNARTEDGRTPLMLAAFDGHTETVRLLLARGANIDDRDPAQRTALMYAASGPNHQTVRLLLGNGADPLAVDREEHFTALMFAASEGQAEVVRALLGHGSDPSMVDVDGDTALDFAQQNGHVDVAGLLRSSE